MTVPLWARWGGGCVEAELWVSAQEVIREEKPRRLHFNLNQTPEYTEGLVCGGLLDIFIEPILNTNLECLHKSLKVGHLSPKLRIVPEKSALGQ